MSVMLCRPGWPSGLRTSRLAAREDGPVDIMGTIAGRVARTRFAREAVADKADLGPFREKPGGRVIAGIVLMGFSYVIGWPAVALLGAVAIYLREPLIVIIGGPLTYGLSHLVFLAGLYLAGAEYGYALARWATRRFVEKYAGREA